DVTLGTNQGSTLWKSIRTQTSGSSNQISEFFWILHEYVRPRVTNPSVDLNHLLQLKVGDCPHYQYIERFELKISIGRINKTSLPVEFNRLYDRIGLSRR